MRFESNLTESFIYDTLNRLTQASGSGMSTRSLSYDALGNITYKSDAGQPIPTRCRETTGRTRSPPSPAR